jgi:hypothetical protein
MVGPGDFHFGESLIVFGDVVLILLFYLAIEAFGIEIVSLRFAKDVFQFRPE